MAGDAAVQEPEVFLWLENVEAWVLFMRCRRQWLTRGSDARAYALNYPGCEVVLRRSGIRSRRRLDELFSDLQVVEDAVLDEWQLRAQREGG